MAAVAETPDDIGVNARRHIRTSAKGGGSLAGGDFFAMGARFGIAFVLARAVGATGYGAVSDVLGIAQEDRDIIERGARKIARTIRRGRPAVASRTAGRR